MIEVTASEKDWATVKDAILGKDTERCVLLLATQLSKTDGTKRLLVREIDIPNDADYSSRSVISAELTPTYLAGIVKRAQRERLSLVFVHSHPGDHAPEFSATDDHGEKLLAKFLSHRHPTVPHAAIVVSSGGERCRALGTGVYGRIVVLGTERLVHGLRDSNPDISEKYDRQLRVFGASGQALLQDLTIGIVGLGGTGSVIAQQLSHLGVRKYILIDPDTVETTNLNRLVGTTQGDIGIAKVEIATRLISQVLPEATISSHCESIIYERSALRLRDADFIFGCTDSHGSRAVLQQISYQYLIPCIDVGSTITAAKGEIKGVHGRVQMLSPGLACFTCSSLLNSEEVRRDMLSPEERRVDPYIPGQNEPAPAVISLNSTVSSLAVTMFMSVCMELPGQARYLNYNALAPSLRSVRPEPDSRCFVCSSKGYLARGDSARLSARKD